MNFRIEELFGAYSLGKNPGQYYLASRPEFKDLLTESLPDSESWANTFVVVLGNFMFGPREVGNDPVQWNTGSPGLHLSLFLLFIALVVIRY